MLARPLLILALLALFSTPARAAPAAAPDSLPAAWLAILRGPDQVTLKHQANRRVPATFVSKLPSWKYHRLGDYTETLRGDRAAALTASLQIERWLGTAPRPTAAQCGDAGARREALSLAVVRGRDTTSISFDLARGTIVMFRTGEHHRGARVGRESAALLKSLADAFPMDALLTGIRPCASDAPLDSASRDLADVIDVQPEALPKALKPVAPKYPRAAVERNIEGTVFVQALIGKDGRVHETMIMNPTPLLDEAAVRAVEQWTFLPALMGDRPVPVWVAVPVKFSLR